MGDKLVAGVQTCSLRNYPGGGSGGSIWITATSVAGTGAIHANGGGPKAGSNGGGGGGRVGAGEGRGGEEGWIWGWRDYLKKKKGSRGTAHGALTQKRTAC